MPNPLSLSFYLQILDNHTTSLPQGDIMWPLTSLCQGEPGYVIGGIGDGHYAPGRKGEPGSSVSIHNTDPKTTLFYKGLIKAL